MEGTRLNPRRSTGKTRTRIRAFSNVPVPTPAQLGVHYVQNLANLAASISPLLVEDTLFCYRPLMSASIHSRWRTSMNDARRKEIQRALTLIGEAKGILELALSQEQEDLDNMPEDLQGDEVGQIAEDVVDALERAAMGCGDAITACKEAMQG